MQIDFDNQALRELYEKGRHRKYRLPTDIVDKFIHRISQLNDAESIHDLMSLKSLHFKKYKEHYSIRVNDKYRIEFQIQFTDASKTIGRITILDVNNHYGD